MTYLRNLALLLALLCSPTAFAQARGPGLSFGASMGVSSQKVSFARLNYYNTEVECSVGTLSLLVPTSLSGEVSLRMNLGDLLNHCWYHDRRFHLDVGYHHVLTRGEETLLFLGGYLTIGFQDEHGHRLWFGGPGARLGLDIGDDKVSLRPFIYMQALLGEGGNQGHLASFSAGVGLEVAFFL